jgi:hypothetical protein
MANIVTNPTADQTIQSFNLLPASGNTSQSLGSSAAPWNATLGDATLVNATLDQLNGGTVICLTGSSDPYNGLIQNAINALSNLGLSGGTIDARSAGCAAVAQGNIDPGSLAITLVLGPNTYTVTSITVRSNLIIFGAGRDNCVIQASGSATTALFFGPGSTSTAALGCVFRDFACYGPSGSSSTPATPNYLDCFHFDCSGATSGGKAELLNSVFERISIYGFGGNNWLFLGANTSGAVGSNQFISLYDCNSYSNQGPGASAVAGLTLTAAANASGGNTVYTGTITGGGSNAYAGYKFVVAGFDNSANNGTLVCTASTTTTLTLNNGSGVSDTHAATATGVPSEQALRIQGANYQIFIYNCDFEGPFANSNIDTTSGNSPLVLLGGGPGSATNGYPYTVGFHGCTIQGRQIAVQLDGALDVTFRKIHMEQNYQCFYLSYGANGANISTQGVVITESSFNGNCAVNSGAGSVLYVNTAHANGISLKDNIYTSTTNDPDNWLVGTSGMTGVTVFNNVQSYDNLLIFSIPQIVGHLTLTGQSAAISATTFYTIPPYAAGLYRISGSIETTTGSGSATASVDITNTNRGGSSTSLASGTIQLSTIGSAQTINGTIHCIASSAVKYTVTISGTVGAARYAVDLRLEYVG